jgi:hypothetical protein
MNIRHTPNTVAGPFGPYKSCGRSGSACAAPAASTTRSPRTNYKAAGALSGPLILYLLEKLGMADLERSGFEIVGGFVVIFRQTTDQDF